MCKKKCEEVYGCREAKKFLHVEKGKSREIERFGRPRRDDFVNALKIDTIKVFLENSKKKYGRRYERVMHLM